MTEQHDMHVWDYYFQFVKQARTRYELAVTKSTYKTPRNF